MGYSAACIIINRIDTVPEETLQPEWPQLLAALVDIRDNESYNGRDLLYRSPVALAT